MLKVDHDPRPLEPSELEFCAFLRRQSDQVRKMNWIFRIGAQAQEMNERGWYPFFVTLTVDPKEHNPEKLWKEGREWQKYLRRVCKVVTDAMGHRPINKSLIPMSEYLTYACCLEHGGSRDHHHAHAVLWLREIPSVWKRCPNRHIRDPKYRDRQRCGYLETLWPFCAPAFRPALYFRCEGDVWSRLGFVTPVIRDKRSGLKKPLPINPPSMAGLYIAKYMTKDDKKWHHRIKATRNLGLNKVKNFLVRLTNNQLRPLTWRPQSQNTAISLQTIHSVPLGLLRRLAQQVIFSREWVSRRADIPSLLTTTCESFPIMLQAVRDGLRPSRLPSKALYDFVGECLPAEPAYCDHSLWSAHSLLEYLYPASFKTAVTHLGGNDIGYT